MKRRDFLKGSALAGGLSLFPFRRGLRPWERYFPVKPDRYPNETYVLQQPADNQENAVSSIMDGGNL